MIAIATPALPKIGQRVSRAHPDLTLVTFTRPRDDKLVCLFVRDSGKWRHYVGAMIAFGDRWVIQGSQGYGSYDAAHDEFLRVRYLRV